MITKKHGISLKSGISVFFIFTVFKLKQVGDFVDKALGFCPAEAGVGDGFAVDFAV